MVSPEVRLSQDAGDDAGELPPKGLKRLDDNFLTLGALATEGSVGREPEALALEGLREPGALAPEELFGLMSGDLASSVTSIL